MRHRANRPTRPLSERLESRLLLAAGDFDLTFGGGDGAVIAAFPGTGFVHDSAEAMAVRPDGKIVLAGTTGNGSNTADNVAIARFNPDGSPDATLNADGDSDGKVGIGIGADVDVHAVAVQADGKIVVVGNTRLNAGSTWDWLVMRLNEDGSVDHTFGGGSGFLSIDFGFGFGDDANAVAVQGDGKIVVAGVAGMSTSNLAVLRFNPDGTLDDTSDGTGFSGDGVHIVDFFAGAVDYASDVIVDPDGKIVVVGGSVPSGSYRRFAMLRYRADGTLDGTFGTGGAVTTNFGVSAMGRQVLRQPDGKYVVGGLVGSSTVAPYAVARYTATGALDTTFGTNAALPGTTLLPAVQGHIFSSYGIARQADGKILFGGYAEQSSPSFSTSFGLARLTDAGAPDSTFGNGGVKLVRAPGDDVGQGADVAVAPDGNILLAGDAWVGQDTDFALLKLKAFEPVVPAGVTLVGSVLTVTGTDGADWFEISADLSTLYVYLNDDRYTFPVGSVASISVDLKGGDDTAYHWINSPGGTVNLGTGDDTISVGFGVKASPALTINGGDDDDTLSLTSAFRVPVTFDGGAGFDEMIYQGTNSADALLVTSDQVAYGGSAFPPSSVATYTATVETIRVQAMGGADIVRVRSTLISAIYILHGADGDDHFLLGDATTYHAMPGPISIDAGAGADEVVVDDSANPNAETYAINSDHVQRSAGTRFYYHDAETLRVIGGTGTSTFTVTPNATTNVFIDGNSPATAPGDGVTVNLTGASGTAFAPLGPGAGRYTFANRGAVEFQGVERDLTVFPPAVKAAQFEYLARQAISFTFSEDVFATVGLRDVVIKNVTTGQTIDSGTFVLNVSGGAGIATTARWEPTTPLPDGNYTVTLARAGVADPAGNTLAADYTLSFFALAGDSDRDRTVGFSDLLALAKNYGKPGSFAQGDFDYNGKVEFADLLTLAKSYGKTLAAPAAPAPTAAAAAAAAAAATATGVSSLALKKPADDSIFSTTPIVAPTPAPAKSTAVKKSR